MITRLHSPQTRVAARKTRRPVKFESGRRFLARLASRRVQRKIALLAALLVGGLTFSTPRVSANTELDVPNGTTDLTTLGATATSDLTFTNLTYNPIAFTANSALTLGTLNSLDATQTLSISGTGLITLSGGTNSVAPNAADLLYVITGGTLNIANNIALTTATASGNFDIAGTSTLSGIVSGTGFGFTKTGAGTLTLSGANTFSGGVNINAGTVSSTNAAGFGTGAVAIGASGTASIQLNGSVANVFTGTGAFTATGNGAGISLTSATALNGFTGTVNITTSGSGKLTLATAGQTLGSGATVNVGATGTLFVQNTAAGGNNFSGVTFNLNGTGNNENLGALRLEGGNIGATSTVNLLANSSIGGNNTASTIAAVISGTGFGFNKLGNNAINLSGTNTYTGATTVSGGLLAFTGGGSSASSAATVSGNSTTTNGLDISFDNSAITGNAAVTRLSSLTLTNNDNKTTYNGLRVIGATTNNTNNSSDTITGALTITGAAGINAAQTATTGVGNVNFTKSGGTGTTTLTVGSINRGTGALLNVATAATTDLGTTDFFRVSGTAPTQFGAGGTAATFTQSIVPWATQTNNGFLTYDATNGFVLAATTGTFTSGSTTLINLRQSGGTITVSAPTTINSYLNATGTSTIAGTGTLTVNSGGMLFSQPTVITAAGLDFGSQEGVLIQEGRNVAITSVITGTGGLTLTRDQGGGTAGANVAFAFGGANTYSGVTTLTGGDGGTELVIGNTNALQNTTLNDVGGVLVFGTTAANQATLGNQDITAANFGGLAGVSNIALTNTGAAGGSVALTVGSDNDSTLYSGVLSDGTSAGGSVTKTGTGTLTLTGTNTFTGGLTINNGAVATGANTTLGGAGGTAGAVTLNGGTLNFTNTAALTNTHPVTVGASGGTISETGAATTGQNSRVIFGTANTLLGSGSLTVSGRGTLGGTSGTTNTGAGTLVLNATNTFSGNVTLQSGGLLEYSVANALGSTATITLGNEGETAINSGLTVANPLTVSGGTNSVLSFENGNAGVYNGAITANATLTVGLRDWYNYNTARSGSITGLISGAGGLTTTGGGTLTLNQAEAYTGATTIGTGSTLKTSNSGTVLASSSSVTIASGGTLDVNGNGTEVVNNLSGAGTLTSSFSQNNSGVSLVNNTATTFSGVINNGLQQTVAKSGTGNLTLSGVNTYTAATNITGGTLTLGVANTLAATSGITVGSNATLSLTAANALRAPVATTGTLNNPVALAATAEVPITLGGGTLLRTGTGVSLGGQSGTTGTVGIGLLTLTAASTLDYGTAGVGTLNFNGFSDSGNFVLTVLNYTHPTSGAGVDGTDDRLIFNQNLSAFLTDFSINGQTPTQVALGNGEYELLAVTAVPEPSTWVVGVLMLGALGWQARRRLAGRFVRRGASV